MEYVGIFGVPRSATSWVSQIFNSSPNVIFRFQPLFSYSLKDRLDENSSLETIDEFYCDLLKTKDKFILQEKNISGNKGLIFEKKELTHLVWKEVRYLYVIENLLINSNTKILGIIRNPCAVINSWLSASKEFRKDLGWIEMKEWEYAPKKNQNRKEEYNGFQKWKEAAYLFIELERKYPTKFKLLIFEEMVANPKVTTAQLYEFFNLPILAQTSNFILQSTTNFDHDPYGVYRENYDINAWKSTLPSSIVKKIRKDLAGTLLEKFV